MIVAIVLVGVKCGKRAEIQDISYEETREKIDNPDFGFYRPVYVEVTSSGVTYNKNIVNANTRLYHLRVDISAFSSNGGGADGPLTKEALGGLDGLLSYLLENDKNAVVRFAYDKKFGGAKNCEPQFDVLLNHIRQVSKVLNDYPQTVTAVEAGLIGPWGEMHSSAIANKQYITPIIREFLDNTQNLPVLVRTPKMIYDFYGITVNDIANFTPSEKRLGMYNDGYLGSSSDLGTYTDRDKEAEFLSKINENLPYGGEVTVPDSPLHDIDKCLPEMFKLHLSYLNVEWNNQVIDKWKNTFYTKECGSDEGMYGISAFEYIQNRLGYRFLITESRAKISGGLQISLKIKNLAFGNMNKYKKAKLIIVKEGEDTQIFELENYSGAGEYKIKVKPEGDIKGAKVYLKLYGAEYGEEEKYCVKFANENIYDENLNANLIAKL